MWKAYKGYYSGFLSSFWTAYMLLCCILCVREFFYCTDSLYEFWYSILLLVLLSLTTHRISNSLRTKYEQILELVEKEKV